MNEEPSDWHIENFVQWLVDKSIAGVPPLTSSKDLALEYLIDFSYENDEDRINSLISWETTKNFTSGFITGLGGLITLPISIPSAFGASWIIQARMAGAIATIYGHDIQSDRVRTMVLLSLLGDAIEQVLKEVGVLVATKVTTRLLQEIPGKLFIEINKRIGFRLITKAGEKGAINVIKGVPVIGGLVSGAFDAAACRTVGRVARDIFRQEEDAFAPPDEIAHLIGSYNDGKILIRYGGIAIKGQHKLIVSCASEEWKSVGMLSNQRFQGAFRGASGLRGMHYMDGTERGFKGAAVMGDSHGPVEWIKDR